MIDANFIHSLEWRALEKLCYHVLTSQDNFIIELNNGGPDGGADLVVKDKDTGRIVEIIQCKAYSKTNKITVGLVRDFMGAMQVFGVSKGTYVTTGTYTSDAIKLANQFNIKLVTTGDLIQEFESLPLSKQDLIEKEIRSSEYTIPTCASCGVKMVLRTKSKGVNKGSQFWGCVNYPKCKSILNTRKITLEDQNISLNTKSESPDKKVKPRLRKKRPSTVLGKCQGISSSPYDRSVNRKIDKENAVKRFVKLLLLKIGIGALACILIFITVGAFLKQIQKSFNTTSQPIIATRQKDQQLTPSIPKISISNPSVIDPPSSQKTTQIVVKQEKPVLPHNSEVYIWTSKKGIQYITADAFLVPEKDYVALDFTRVDNRKVYTIVGNNGTFSKTNGVPISTRQNNLRLINVK